ncbi:MAG: AMP-binding protein, partial [Gammaproteobacteria bacterium]
MSQQRSDLTHHDASGDKKSRASDSASEQLEKEARIVSGPALEDAGIYKHIVEVFNEACHNYATRSAFTNLGYTITFSELQRLATDFASFLNNVLNLEPGTRVAIQLPNVLQYPIVLFGALKAGMIVINTNPLYTVREMVHQFNDSEAQVLISLVNFGDRIAEAVPKTSIRTVVLSELGDVLPAPKRYV